MSSALKFETNEPVVIVKSTPNQPAWSRAPTSVPQQSQRICSLSDVMSEQLAQELYEKESTRQLNQIESTYDIIDKVAEELITTNNNNNAKQTPVVNNESQQQPQVDTDFMLAQLLQLEFDKEYDMQLKQQEDLRNKNSTISVSYDKFRSVHPIIQKDEQAINEMYADESSSDSEEDKPNVLSFKRGVRGKGENMISKHDLELSAKNNGSKVMNFPPEFETGDGHNFEFRLSNKVFNQLKMHSFHEGKRGKIHDKQDKSTAEMALDPKTKLILYKFVNADILDSIGGVISTGKEATILYAAGGKSQEVLVPKECVAKVYKTTLNEFKTREKYIAEDYRFKDRYKHLNPQKIVKLWAEKEMHNLMKMRRFDIPCPDVILLKKHVLLMSFIGHENMPAPKIKDAILNDDELKSAYEQCVQIMQDLYTKCNLVHADFNQFNLLWHENKVWVIDVSQSVEPISPLGLEFLFRDCKNIHKFFSPRLESCMTPEELFMKVTGMKFEGEGEEFLAKIQKYTKNKQIEMRALNTSRDEDNEKEFNFDYLFDKTQKEKSSSS